MFIYSQVFALLFVVAVVGAQYAPKEYAPPQYAPSKKQYVRVQHLMRE